MPTVNGNESTSPREGGNVEEATTTKTYPRCVTEASVAKTSLNQTLSQTNLDTNVREKLPNTYSTKDRQHVVKQLGVTSTSFIGPVCRPELPSFEKELCEFYKELEEVDHSDKVDGHGLNEQGRHLNPPHSKYSPAVATDHSRAYRPYPDPHERSGQQCQYGDPKTWRPRTQSGMENFGKRGPWYTPPPWVPQGRPNSGFQYLPPPSAGSPMYPPDIRPQQNFHSHTNTGNWTPWEGSRLPPNDWYDYGRSLPSYGYSGFSREYNKPSSNWQENPEQQYGHSEDQYHHSHYNRSLHLILLRGLPGSGKSTLGRELLSSGPNGTILSTDDYFFQDNIYVFNGTLLADAHDWNQKRAEHAMSEGCSPIVIDNTNIKAWEMKPYVKMALKNGYKVDFREPETNWKYDPAQLEKRNKHGVPQETIAKMLQRFERPMSVDIVMNSVEPPHKSRGH